jgi:hypothetical protein
MEIPTTIRTVKRMEKRTVRMEIPTTTRTIKTTTMTMKTPPK